MEHLTHTLSSILHHLQQQDTEEEEGMAGGVAESMAKGEEVCLLLPCVSCVLVLAMFSQHVRSELSGQSHHLIMLLTGK